QQQRAEAGALAPGKTADYELAGLCAFHLQPLAIAAAAVGAVTALADDAFEAKLAGVPVHLLAVTHDVIGIADARVIRMRRQQLAQDALAIEQRRARDVPLLQLQRGEQPVDEA